MNSNVSLNLDPMIIAKYLFYNGTDMSNLKLQKLLFFAYKDYYIEYKSELFKDDFQAWIYGPVLPEIYKNFYKILSDNNFNIVQDYFEDKKEVVEFLDKIIAKYDSFSSFELVKKTHEEKSWKNARKGMGDFESSTKKLNIKNNI